MIPLTEPVYVQDFAAVRATQSGKPIPTMDVGWPGPNVELTPAGVPGPGALMFHGFYEGPLPGRKVLMGFPGGNSARPVVLQKYSYGHNFIPGIEAAHVTPFTKMGVHSLDTGIGHFMGSHILLRAGPFFPFPGGIDIKSMSRMMTLTLGGYQLESSADWTIDAVAAASILSGTIVTITAGTSIALVAVGTPEPIVKGTQAVTKLTEILTAIQAITVPTAMGPSGIPINSAAFASISSALASILSTSITAT